MNDFRALIQLIIDKAQARNEFNSAIKDLQKEAQLKTDLKINTSDVKKAQKELNGVSTAVTKLASESQRLSKTNTIKTWADNNSKAMKVLKADVNGVLDRLRNPKLSAAEFKQINAEFEKIKFNARETGLLGKTIGDSFKDMGSKFVSWVTVSGSVMLFVQRLKESVTELKNINTILTEISKTNDTLSKTDLMKIGSDSFSKASKYGKSATDYLSGIQEASRAGYIDAEGVAELSVLAQSAGDMTKELANQYLIATDAAYKLQGQTEKLNEVLDGQNYITNKNAVNMTDLAEATKVAASQANSAQVPIDKMTAAVSTMIATTQQGGDIAGRAFKAILMNIQQVSGVVDEESGEIVGEDELTKYEEAADALGVKLKEVKDGYLALRDPMQVLKELSEAYTALPEDDTRRANLINAVGGKIYHVAQKCATRMILIAGNALIG